LPTTPTPTSPSPSPSPSGWGMIQTSQVQQPLSSDARNQCNDGIDNNKDGLPDLQDAWCIKQYQLAGYEGVQADSQQCAARNGRPLRAAEQAAFCQTGRCQGTPGSTPPSSGSGCGSGSGTRPGGAVSCRPTTQGDYYVATNGSDSHSCAQARNPATPKRSIRAAMACMSGGNTLLIRDGTYAECLKTPDFKSGTAGNRTVIKNYGTEKVTLKPHRSGGCWHVVTIAGEKKYITIDGIKMDGSNVPGNLVEFSPTNIGRPTPFSPRSENYYVKVISHFELLNAKLSYAGSCGIQGRANNSLFRNLEIQGTRSICYGFYFNGHDTIIENNHIHHNARGGMQLYAQGGDSTISRRLQVRNNWVHDNCQKPERGCIGGILIANGTDKAIYNNLLVNHNRGIRTYSASRNTQIYNNTLINNRIPIDLSKGSGTVVRNNTIRNGAAPAMPPQGVGPQQCSR
jgi:parallel beta-helix repeat protein